MAEAIVGPLLSKLQEVTVNEAKALAAVGSEIDLLREKLAWLQAFVNEADLRCRHDGSRFVRLLAFQIRAASFEVEDAVDHFYLQGSLSRRFGRHRLWRISKEFILNLRTHVFVRAILSRRIRSINVRLEAIMENRNTYTFGVSDSADGTAWRASTIPPMRADWDRDYSEEIVLKYRGKEKEELMNEINNKNVSEVITVVGVEGVGKTALLMHAYKESKQEGFKRIWLSFPPDISDESMLKQIQEKLGSEKVEVFCLVVIDCPVSTTTWRKVENKILNMVGKGSKIVLSVTSSWREEKINQSTTMSRDDSKEETHCTIKLGTMKEAQSIKLFNHIYCLEGRRTTNYQIAEMDHIHGCIMEITNGLPLAVVLVAKLMRTVDFGKWEAAADYLKCNSEDNKLKTILSVCIDDLSDELKSCLLHTAGFPENRPIDAHQLVRLWMAEGFLTQQHKLETEKLGQCYLKELIYRGLLHLKKKAPGGHVQWVAIPDQIHPLLRSEAQRTSFMNVHYGGSLPPPGNTRRLALHSYNDEFPALDNCLEKLRTVISYSDDYTVYPYGHKQEKLSKDEHEPEQKRKDEREFELKPEPEKSSMDELQPKPEPEPEPEQTSKDEPMPEPELKPNPEPKLEPEREPEPEQSSKDDPKPSPKSELEPKPEPELLEPKPEPRLVMRELLQRSPYLRVINLEGIQVVRKKRKDQCALPHAIGEMVHLQYLGVRCWELKEVPSSIGNLRNLQTIDVRGTGVRSLPNSLWKVKTLRNVLGDRLAFPRSSTGVADHPKVMHTLESVTIDHQDDDSCRCFTGAACKIRKLELLRFKSLHRLHVAELKESQVGALASVLEGLCSLEALILSGEKIPMDFFTKVPKSTSSWMKHMESLMLAGALHLPDSSNIQDESNIQDASNKKLVDYPCLVNVTHLVLRSTNIGQEFIHCIGKLPVLAELELLEGSYKDKELTFGPDEFNSLTMLRISALDTLEKISVSDATKRNKAINMDVPDHVKVVAATDEQSPSEGQPIADTAVPDRVEAVTTDEQSPSEQRPDAGTAARNQQPEGGEQHDQSNSNDQATSGQPMQDGSPSKDKHSIITEMILEAAHFNNSSITSITNYIKDTYVAVCLDQMEQSGKFQKQKTNNGRGRSNKYVLDPKSNWSSSLPDKLQIRIITEMILEAANKNYSSITSITNYIKDTYVAKCLDDMVKSRMLRKEKANGHYDKYVLIVKV